MITILLGVGCSSFLPGGTSKNTIKPIEDGLVVESIVQIQDDHRSIFAALPPPRSPQGVVLFDAGDSADESNPILAFLTENELTTADVSHIFLTHEHQSHTEGVALFPDAEVLALSEAAPEIIQQGGRVDTLLEAGEKMEVGPHTVEIFSMPGHCDGNSSFLFNQTLMMGDAAVAYMDDTIEPMEGNATSIQSLSSLSDTFSQRTHDVEVILFSHSGPIYGVDALIEYSSQP